MDNEIKKLLAYLPSHTAGKISALITAEPDVQKYMTEIRLHSKRPTSLNIGGKNVSLFFGEADICSETELASTLARLTEDSVHTYGDTMREGFINLDGGYRIGICGHANTADEHIKGIYGITSLCIRIPRVVKGISGAVLDKICRGSFIESALIYSPPGVGKTTLLRDIASVLSSGTCARRIAVVDTRREIFIDSAFRYSIADFLIGYPRASGIEIATRILCPEAIICDEIGGAAEASAIITAQNTGVPLIATAHGSCPEELFCRPHIKSLCDAGIFRFLIGICRASGEERFRFSIKDMREG